MPFLETGRKITHIRTHMQTKQQKTCLFTILKIYNRKICLQNLTFIGQKEKPQEQYPEIFKILTGTA